MIGSRLAATAFLLGGGFTPATYAFGEERGFPAAQIEALGLTGSARVAFWGASRDLLGGRDWPGGTFWLAAQPTLGENAYLRVEGWLGDQDLIHPAHPAGDLREAYFDGRLGALALRVGRQIVVWGRADALNPTDSLTPRDYTRLVAVDDEQRRGIAQARITLSLAPFMLTGIWLPEFRSNILPLGAPPAGVTFAEVDPRGTARQWALKLEQSGGAVDWSLSFFDGFDRNPDLSILSAGATGTALGLSHGRIRVVGADAASTLGRFGIRAEAAYTFTEDWAGSDPLTKNPFLSLVAGTDRTFGEHLNVNLQYALRVISRWQNPAQVSARLRLVAEKEELLTQQQDRVQHGVTLRIADKWLDDTLEGEVSGLLWLASRDFVVRPRLAYAISDHLKGVAGVELYGGPADSFLGRLRDSTGAFAEFRYSF